MWNGIYGLQIQFLGRAIALFRNRVRRHYLTVRTDLVIVYWSFPNEQHWLLELHEFVDILGFLRMAAYCYVDNWRLLAVIHCGWKEYMAFVCHELPCCLRCTRASPPAPHKCHNFDKHSLSRYHQHLYCIEQVKNIVATRRKELFEPARIVVTQKIYRCSFLLLTAVGEILPIFWTDSMIEARHDNGSHR